MTWLEMCLTIVKPFEGCHKKLGKLVYPYLDKLAKPPVYTRGYGRTYGITATSVGITIEEADKELSVGLHKYAMQCALYAPNLLTKPECMAAVGSWAWNCGTGAFKVSRLRKAINEGRWEDAAVLIKKPNTAGGVVYRGLELRRTAEAKLFRLGL